MKYPGALITSRFLTRVPLLALFIFLAANEPGWCQEEVETEESTTEPDLLPPVTIEQQSAVYGGYRFVSSAGSSMAVAPYLPRTSGATGGFSLGASGGDLKLTTEGQFLHEDDYHAGLLLDYAGLYHMRLDTATLWHNLDHLSLTPGSLTAVNLDKATGDGVRTSISQMDNRIKLGNNPIHLNLGYRELSRSGTTQLRFSDYGFDAKPGSVISQTGLIDSTTREVNVGLDAYLGPITAAYDFSIRDYVNNAPDPRYLYSARDGQMPGFQAHDTTADNRVTTNTITLTSDQSGGLVTSAIYSLTRRESSANHGDTRPSSHPADTLQSIAGDISYTPFRELSLALKYLRLVINHETPTTVYSPYSLTPSTPTPVYTAKQGVLLVRPSSDSSKDVLTFSASWRPIPKALYRLEYKAELESRNNLPDQRMLSNPVALHEDDRHTHTVTASFLWRPFNAVRFNALYSYATCDNPAYLASFAERHTGRAQVSYSDNGHWGITANYREQFESGENSSGVSRLPRENASSVIGSTLWISPIDRVTMTAGYAFFRSRTNQLSLVADQYPSNLIFSMENSYRSVTHSYNLDTVMAVTPALDLSLSFQQIFSDIRYSATDNSTNPLLSATGVGDASRLVSTETGVTARGDWRFSRTLGYSMAYSFKKLVSGSALYDGIVHESLVALTGNW